MRAIQHQLPGVNLARPMDTRELALLKRKHEMISGRPRRLKSSSKVIKVAITPRKILQIDRMRIKMSATRPEAIRTAVEQFVERSQVQVQCKACNGDGCQPAMNFVGIDLCSACFGKGWVITTPAPIVKPESKGKKKGRCEYVKIPLPPYALDAIGHQAGEGFEASGLCLAMNGTRQQVINLAIDEWLGKYI
jgi:hypothetical protein